MTENTRDLSKFGYRELDMAADLLKALANPSKSTQQENFEIGDEIALEFNPNSGNVFLVSEDDYTVGMINGDGKLENFVHCSNCGKGGFTTELAIDEDGNCSDCEGK